MTLLGSVLALVVASAPLAWPVDGPILRAYDGPDTPYSSGHRGIDIGTPVGTQVRAAGSGTVAFAGKVGGALFVSIDHAGGLRSTYSWLTSATVRQGDVVSAGDVVATTGWGHSGTTSPHLHFGLRLNGDYVDPMDYLPGLDLSTLIRLAPINGP